MMATDENGMLGNKGAHIYYGNIEQCENCKKFYKTKKKHFKVINAIIVVCVENFLLITQNLKVTIV